MRRYLYRCPVCRTTSPVVHTPAAAAKEGNAHRHELHGGHYPDAEQAGEVDRRGRWYACLPALTATHTRLSDTLADLTDPGGSGTRLWAVAASWLILTAAAALGLLAAAATLQP